MDLVPIFDCQACCFIRQLNILFGLFQYIHLGKRTLLIQQTYHFMQKLLALSIIIVLATCPHPLTNFQKQIALIKQHYAAAETSHVFSLFMKIFVQTKMLYQGLEIAQPKNGPDLSDKNCQTMMKQLVQLFALPHWVQVYQQIFARLSHIQQKCTSSDFLTQQKGALQIQCAVCTVLIRIMQNYITLHRKDVAKFVQSEFCSHFDGLVKPTCEAFTHYAGPFLIKGLLQKQSPDVICHSTGICKNATCRILDQRASQVFSQSIEKLTSGVEAFSENRPSPWQWLVDLFKNRFGDKHLPPFDFDQDSFSDISTFRGYHWRGADCNQLNPNVYPGRKNGKDTKDHDCNGIWGVDKSGMSLQKKLCENYTRLGVGVIGDSAGAHFSIPEKFFNVTMMNNHSFHDLLPRLADELDIPHESAYTAHTNTEYATHSVYKHLRQWNMCNNNDFQNLGVNGGDSGSSFGNIKALKRDKQNDHPMLMFLELIGNDVCSSSPNGYTPRDQFKKNIKMLLEQLDSTLPKGSHLVIIGLADGDLLFEYLHGTMHPLQIPYDNVYDFLNCLQISPCAGWLNTNATIRKRTTQHAKMLSKVYEQVLAQTPKFNNFDVAYYDFPTEDIFKRMYLDGREPAQMIERCDGFHPSGLFNSYLADWLWYKINQDNPQWIGKQNPNNQEIRKLFGLQDLK